MPHCMPRSAEDAVTGSAHEVPRLRGGLLLLLPTYNNASTLRLVLEDVRAQCACEILVVDDGSRDGTAEILASAVRDHGCVSILTRQENGGKGAALRDGFLWARARGFDWVLTMDTDGQHFASDLPRLIEALPRSPTRILLGVRDFAAADAGHVPGASRFGRAFSDFWIRLETGARVLDSQSGLRAYPVQKLPLAASRTRRYDFEVEILVRSLWAGLDVSGIPVRVYYPDPAERVSHFHALKDNIRLSVLHTRLCCEAPFRRALRARSGVRRGLAGGRIDASQADPSTAQQGNAASGERRGARLMPLFLNMLGARACYLIAPIIVFFYFATGRAARKGVVDFHHALGRRGLHALGEAFRNYVYFTASLIDRIALSRPRGGTRTNYVMTPLSTAPKGDLPVVFIGAHFGDWFTCGQGHVMTNGRKLAIVMDVKRNPNFTRLMGHYQSARLKLIDVGSGGVPLVLHLKECLDDGYSLCFLGDRGQDAARAQCVSFLGRPAPFPLFPYEVAVLLRCPVFAFFSTKAHYHPDAPYNIEVIELWDGQGRPAPGDVLGAFTRALEQRCRTAPQHWFNFHDFWATT